MINSHYFSDVFFQNAIDSFQNASDSMIDYQDSVIDFDKVKINYCERYGSSNEASQSADVLILNKQDKIVFIEFKTGKINNRNKKSRLKSKLRDSILIFNDINKLDLDFSRNNVEYILVYNQDENRSSVSEQKSQQIRQNEAETTDSLRDIQQFVANKAGEEFVYFGLEVLKKVFISDVHTYTKTEFDEYYNTQLK